MQTFNDGLVKIYAVTDISELGGMPREGLKEKCALRFRERTVGFNRYWAGQQSNVEISLVLRCPCFRGVSTQDIAIPNNGEQYRIVQVQFPEGLNVMDLSLVRLEADYDFAG